MNHQAIYNTHSNVKSIRGDECFDAAGNKVTLDQSAVDTEVARLATEFNNTAYARAREIAYPVTKEFIEAYTEKEIDGDSTKWDAYVIKRNKVRTDNPK